jgi:hypothetical protein
MHTSSFNFSFWAILKQLFPQGKAYNRQVTEVRDIILNIIYADKNTIPKVSIRTCDNGVYINAGVRPQPKAGSCERTTLVFKSTLSSNPLSVKA